MWGVVFTACVVFLFFILFLSLSKIERLADHANVTACAYKDGFQNLMVLPICPGRSIAH
jgi:hypothetical protein